MSDIIEEKIEIKKEYIKQQTLDEDVKENLKKIMKDKYEEKEKFTIQKYKKVVGIVACFIILSTVTFAGRAGNFLSNLFANIEIKNDQMINPEAIVKIDSEYVTHDGIGLNVSYLYEEDEYIYIVLNVQGIDNDVKNILVDEIKFNDLNNEKTYSSEQLYANFFAGVQYKTESKVIFIKLIKSSEFNLTRELELSIKNLKIESLKKEDKYIVDNWILKIKKP